MRLLLAASLLLFTIPAAAELRGDPGIRLSYDADGNVRRATGELAPPAQGAPVEIARAFLRSEAASLGLADPDRTLRLARVTRAGDRASVHFEQILSGLPVVGRGVVVVVARDGSVSQVSVSIGRFDRVTTTVSTSLDDALAKAADVSPGDLASDPTARLALLGRGRAARAVWVVDFATAAPSGEWRLYLDAATARPLLREDLRRYALGRIYDPNSIVAPDLVDADLPNLTSTTQLTGLYADALNCTTRVGDSCRSEHVAAPDVDGNYLFDPIEGQVDELFPEVMAYYHVDKINRYFRDAHGYEYGCEGGNAMRARVNVHDGIDTPLDNAYYGDANGDGCGDLTFGQGTEVDFAYDADVIYHEFTHDVINTIVGPLWMNFDTLGVDPTPGAFSEGTADYFSVSFTDDQALGDYALGESGAGETVARTADNDLSCPRDIFGESHFDGRIWLGAMWEARTTLGATKADALVFLALQRFTDDETFDDAAVDVRAAANDLEADGVLTADDVVAVEASLDSRGLTDCVRIVPLEDDTTTTALVLGTNALGGGWFDVPFSTGPVQYSFTAPENVSFFGFTVTHLLRGAGHDYVIHMRKSLAPAVDWDRDTIASDHVFEDNPADVTMSLWSDPAIEGGETYYFLIENRDDQEIVVSLHATVGTIYIPDSGPYADDAGPDAGDAAADADADTDSDSDSDSDTGTPPHHHDTGGCGCRAPASTPTGSAFLFAIVVGCSLRAARRRKS